MASKRAPGDPPTPKTMSSRLLTMKFMQRAAASSPQGATPDSDEQASKRRKTSGQFSPGTPTATFSAVKAAVAAEEAKRQEALSSRASISGESKWTLSYKPVQQTAPRFRVVTVSLAEIDSRETNYQAATKEEDDNYRLRDAMLKGRRSFGKFNRTIEKYHRRAMSSQTPDDTSDSDSSDSSEDSAVDSSTDDVTNLIRNEAGKQERQERRTQRKAAKEKKKAAPTKEVNLQRLTSISGGGTLPSVQKLNKRPHPEGDLAIRNGGKPPKRSKPNQSKPNH